VTGEAAVTGPPGERPRSDALVVFGFTGDLARKQIFPALYRMVKSGEMTVPVVGVSTSSLGPDEVREAMRKPTKLLFVETLSNPLLRLADLEALAELAGLGGTRLVVDNTFTTPILVRPLRLREGARRKAVPPAARPIRWR